MRTRTLIWLGSIVFVVVLAATLPASLVASRLPAAVRLDGAFGSVFSGGAEQLTLNGAALGELDWSFNPAALLSMAMGYHIDLKGPSGEAHGDIARGFSGALSIDGLKAALPLSTLTRAAGQATSVGGAGRVRLDLRHARLLQGWPTALEGTIELDDLQPAMVTAPIGNYEIRFDPAAGDSAAGVHGSLRDLNAPLAVEGRVSLAPDHTYVIEGTLTTKPTTPPQILPALDAFGPADARGRRPFSIGGTF